MDKFKREKFFDKDRNRWVLRSTREDDGASLQMTFNNEPDKVQQVMNYELIEFKLVGIRSPDADRGPEGIGGQTC